MMRAVRPRAFPRMMQWSMLAVTLALLAACGKPADTARIPADPAHAHDVWTRFIRSAERMENQAGPFRLNATLYYSGQEGSQRVTVYCWGNGGKEVVLPLRLDILMGPGSVMAAVREDSHGLFIYVPRDETVYQAEDGTLLAFDVPLPFSLADLACLVTGRFAALFAPPDGGDADRIRNTAQGEKNTLIYDVAAAPLPGMATLDENGLPVAWSDGKDWTLTIEYWPDSTRTTPRKLHIRHANGREATLIVRELSRPEPFTSKQLELAVPQTARLTPLAAGR